MWGVTFIRSNEPMNRKNTKKEAKRLRATTFAIIMLEEQ